MLKFGGFLALGAAAAAFSATPTEVSAQGSGSQATFLTCNKTILHFTQRGFAFECQTPGNSSNRLLVVRDENFPNRVDHVIDILREHNARNLPTTGRQRGNVGLWVTFRRADGPAQSVCNAVRPQATSTDSPCLIATDIAYR